MRRALLLAVSAASLAACATVVPPKVAQPFPPVHTVAVLPMDNGTNDFDGPVVVRREFAVGMARKGYRVVPFEKVDKDLKERFGITDGGQLPSVDAAVLASTLAVDAVLYGFLDTFTDQDFGYYRKRKVAAAMRLVDRTGKDAWVYADSFANQDIALSKKEAKAKLAIGLAQKALEKILHAPLVPETRALVMKMLSSVPTAGPPVPPPPEAKKNVANEPKERKEPPPPPPFAPDDGPDKESK